MMNSKGVLQYLRMVSTNEEKNEKNIYAKSDLYFKQANFSVCFDFLFVVLVKYASLKYSLAAERKARRTEIHFRRYPIHFSVL